MHRVRARFGVEDRCVTQAAFGTPGPVGAFLLEPDRRVGVLGTELTHAGRRLRSWFLVFEPGEGGGGGARVPGVDGAVDLLACVVQPRHHRKDGPVRGLLDLAGFLEDRNVDPSWAPSAFWLAAGVAAGSGGGVRRPRNWEIRQWKRR